MVKHWLMTSSVALSMSRSNAVAALVSKTHTRSTGSVLAGNLNVFLQSIS